MIFHYLGHPSPEASSRHLPIYVSAGLAERIQLCTVYMSVCLILQCKLLTFLGEETTKKC